jgi:quercetin dioxygenase-like cupin family protein
LAGALVVSGCSSKSNSPAAKSFLRTTLASGPWPNLPSTPLYLAVMDFPQPNGEAAPTGGHMHPPGFVFGLTGIARVLPDGGGHIDVGPGQAIFAPPFVHHQHSNPGPGPDNWLFFGPRTETVRNMPLPSPEAISLLAGPTLTGLQVGQSYMLQLDQLTIRPGGQSPVQRQNGPTIVYVLDGQVSMHTPHAGPQQLKWGATTILNDGDISQLRNDSPSDQAQVMVMTMWIQGQQPDTPVNSSLT